MKKRWARDDAVSPVIATILMVAITVVLAAVLYVMVIGMGGDTGTTEVPIGLAQQDRDDTYVSMLIAKAPNTALIDGSTVIMTKGSDGTPIQVNVTVYYPNGNLACTYSSMNGTWEGLTDNTQKFINGMQIVVTTERIEKGDRIVMTGIGFSTTVMTIN